MYNTIADIDREIAALQEQRDYEILYWFELGERDHEVGLPPQYPDNDWYLLGWHDRDYQVAIGFNQTPVTFDHF